MQTNIDVSGMLSPCRATYQYGECQIQIRYDAYRPQQIIQYRFIEESVGEWQLMPFRVVDLGNKTTRKAFSLFKAYISETQA